MGIQEKIKNNKRAVLSGRQVPHGKPCPKCFQVCEQFKLHSFRSRLFLVVLEALVHRVDSELARWRCPYCDGTFTDYPAFAIPGRRYILAEVLKRCEGYLADPGATYERAVQTDNQDCVYIDTRGARKGWHLCASTLWRWLGFLGRLPETLRRSLKLIRERDPRSGVFRAVCPLPARKYRSAARRRVLEAAWRLLGSAAEFRRLFGRELFPDFAIVCAWH